MITDGLQECDHQMRQSFRTLMAETEKPFTPVVANPPWEGKKVCYIYQGDWEDVDCDTLPASMLKMWPAIHAADFEQARHKARLMFDDSIIIHSGKF